MTRVLRNGFGRRVLTLRRNEHGNALIELAIVGVLFFTLVLGIMEFGRAIWMYGTVAHLAREGARYAIVRGTESGDTASATDVETYVQSRAAGMTGLAVTTVWDPDNDPGSVVQVQVDRTFNPVVPMLGLGSIVLSSTSRLVISF